MSAPLPACPSCSTALSPSRIVDGGRGEEADGETRELAWAHVACGGCLSIVRCGANVSGQRTHVEATVHASGAVIARFRDEVLLLRERGSLEEEIPSLLADAARSRFLGVPEVAREVLATGAGKVRLKSAAYVHPVWFVTPFAPLPDALENLPTSMLAGNEDARAERDGSFGGFVFDRARTLVLPLQKFDVIGFFGGRAHVAAPKLVTRHLSQKTHPGYHVAWELLTPDRARRPR